jgi:hypothetical protein
MSQDNSRTPPRRPTGNDTMQSAKYQEDFPEENHRDHDRNRRRSKSPRRERRGRYVDRDGEGYESPARNRSRSPYYGGTPNRNVILEGIPIDMAQEDVCAPSHPFLGALHHTLIFYTLISSHGRIRTLAKMRTGQLAVLLFTDFQ